MATAKHPAPLSNDLIFNLTQPAWDAFYADRAQGWSTKHGREWLRMHRLLSNAAAEHGANLAAVPGDLLNTIIAALPSRTYRADYPGRLRMYHRWQGEHVPMITLSEPLPEPEDSVEAAPPTDADAPDCVLSAALPSFDVRRAELLHDATLRLLEYGHAMAALERYDTAGAAN